MRGQAGLSCGVILASLLLAGGGCYEEVPPPAQAAPNPGQPPAPGTGGGGGAQAGGGNAYGGAKRAAQNTVDKVQQRQEEVDKAAKDDEQRRPLFGRRIQLFRILGFSVGIDPSWFVIVALVTWTLAEGVYTRDGLMGVLLHLGDLPASARWTMGVAGALGLFGSIVAHELAHALVARRYGIQMRGITLFIFGGVAEMADEPPHPEAELMVAIAGPIASVIIGVSLLALALLVHLPRPVSAVILHTGLVNLMLVAFNVLPAFPLDGGRVLRSVLWAWKNDLTWATRVTSRLGSWFGIGLIVLAVLSVSRGDFIGGAWWFLLGMFLRSAASASYRHLLVRRTLEGQSVRRLMHAPRTVAPDIVLQELVDEHVLRHQRKMFPVVGDGKLLGWVTTRQVRQVPRHRWGCTTVRDVVVPCSSGNTISAHADAAQAMARMSRGGASWLLVVDEGQLVGVLSMPDLLRYMAIRVELGS